MMLYIIIIVVITFVFINKRERNKTKLNNSGIVTKGKLVELKRYKAGRGRKSGYRYSGEYEFIADGIRYKAYDPVYSFKGEYGKVDKELEKT